MIVKICGITCAEDLSAAVEAGATAIGFNFFEKSPRYITPARAAELAPLAPEAILKVGVFVNAAAGTISEIAGAVPLDAAQLHGQCERPAGIRVWRALAVDENFDPAVMDTDPAEAFLLDAPAGQRYGGTGRPFDWNRVAGLRRRIILAGGLGEDNVAEAIRVARPWGVDACSRLEARPGKKDNDRVRAFITAALGAEN